MRRVHFHEHNFMRSYLPIIRYNSAPHFIRLVSVIIVPPGTILSLVPYMTKILLHSCRLYILFGKTETRKNVSTYYVQ